MRGDSQIPLVVGQALTGLNDNHPSDPIGSGNRLMILRKKITMEHLVVLLDPSETFGPVEIPQVNMSINHGNRRSCG
ncbi:hypothetical protein LBMAG56_01200 [Verrucomicrobiota bacterium]|nr:hypothetical protein LBMAG56_01200 [Verrucomicrobiota bacterium]